MEGYQELQRRVLRLTKIGIVFSILWLAGIGSLIAFILGLKARRIIKESGNDLSGTGGAWWCIIVGAAGMLFWLVVIVIGTVGRST
jgi:hypothetical protein